MAAAPTSFIPPNVHEIQGQIDTVIGQIKRDDWKNREDQLCDKVNGLMQGILINNSELVRENPAISASLSSLAKILGTLATTSIKVSQKTLEALDLIGRGVALPDDHLSQITRRLPAGSNHEIQHSLSIFKRLAAVNPKTQFALAEWVSYNKIPLSKLELRPDELMSIAPHLTFMHLDKNLEMPREAIQALLSLATNLRTLLFENDNVIVLPEFSKNVKLLTCHSDSLVEISAFHDGLDTVDVSHCPKLEVLPPRLPNSVTSFNCSNCDLLPKPPELNPNLIVFYAAFCPNLELPERLPDSIRDFNCNHDTFQRLPILSGGLLSLDTSGCDNLIEIPSVPPTLEKMDVSDCGNLEHVALSPRLKSLSARGCPKLILPVELPPGLTVSR